MDFERVYSHNWTILLVPLLDLVAELATHNHLIICFVPSCHGCEFRTWELTKRVQGDPIESPDKLEEEEQDSQTEHGEWPRNL